ncbi:MAG: 2'-5' RNA ligase family protein [Egibacteraceae bacterium]
MDVVRVDFALIPDDPLFGAVVSASQAITDEFSYNQNVIDDKDFPPHLSLHICTVPRDKIGQIVVDLRALAEGADLPDITPIGVDPAHGGYVMVNVERTAEIVALHEAILDVAAIARDGLDGDTYGNEYVREFFTPHISLAKVDRHDLSSAADIGRKALGDWYTTRTRTLDLCDIGPRSERWDVLASFCH